MSFLALFPISALFPRLRCALGWLFSLVQRECCLPDQKSDIPTSFTNTHREQNCKTTVALQSQLAQESMSSHCDTAKELLCTLQRHPRSKEPLQNPYQKTQRFKYQNGCQKHVFSAGPKISIVYCKLPLGHYKATGVDTDSPKARAG